MEYSALSNAQLLERLRELAQRERTATADFVDCLIEADRREQAVLDEGYPSLFDFCVRDLKLAESTAYQRVKAARLARSRPEVLALLRIGEITLSTLCLIAPHVEEHPRLLEGIRGKAKREVEALVSTLGKPRTVPDRIRALPRPPAKPAVEEELFAPAGPEPNAAPPTAAAVHPAEPQEFLTEFRFAAGQSFVLAVDRLRSLLWHKHPMGRLEDILLEAADAFLQRNDPARNPSRHGVPAARPMAQMHRTTGPRSGSHHAVVARRALGRPLKLEAALPGSQPHRG